MKKSKVNKKPVEEYNITGITSGHATGKLKEIIKDIESEKVESKFKVGYWAVWDNKISCHIDNIYQGKESLMYEITDAHNMPRSYGVKGFDNNAHLWTINDARDGDVLAEDSCIFIIEKMNPNGTARVHCCLFDDGEFDLTGSTLGFDVDSTHPATKEQRDTLMKAMADAGWEFDFDKKELKKIDNGIEIPFGAKDSELQEATYFIPKGFHAEIDDDKVVIKRGKQKPAEWSEEDEK